jgi:hypothetical protein
MTIQPRGDLVALHPTEPLRRPACQGSEHFAPKKERSSSQDSLDGWALRVTNVQSSSSYSTPCLYR